MDMTSLTVVKSEGWLSESSISSNNSCNKHSSAKPMRRCTPLSLLMEGMMSSTSRNPSVSSTSCSVAPRQLTPTELSKACIGMSPLQYQPPSSLPTSSGRIPPSPSTPPTARRISWGSTNFHWSLHRPLPLLGCITC
jgi:hypothetical protein